jgi:hypothetical protein
MRMRCAVPVARTRKMRITCNILVENAVWKRPLGMTRRGWKITFKLMLGKWVVRCGLDSSGSE